jgi:hypothetical protein
VQQIEPSTLHRRLSEYFAGHHYDGLFIASLDHSSTEQLIGSGWHTAALILSAEVEHSALAHELGQIANPLTRKLTKWTRAYSHYKERFCASLMSKLKLRRVMVFAISAKEPSIAASEEHFISYFGVGKFDGGTGETPCCSFARSNQFTTVGGKKSSGVNSASILSSAERWLPLGLETLLGRSSKRSSDICISKQGISLKWQRSAMASRSSGSIRGPK